MRNHQESCGNRYQFRLHPAPPPSPPLYSSPTGTTALSSARVSPTLLGATIMTTQQQQHQQQQYQSQQLKPLMTKIDEVQPISNIKIENNNIKQNNNNNKNNNCEKTRDVTGTSSITSTTTATAITSTTTIPTITNSNSNVLHLQRKQFTPTSDASNSSFSSASVAGSIQDDMSDQCSLTQAGLEEYNIRASSYYDQPALYHHQKQSSYAQSEGYHSYVSSSDSSSATPFLDRLRQESGLLSRQSLNWSQNDLSSVSCNSVAPSPTPLLLNANTLEKLQTSQQQQSPSQQNNNSSESTSSTETLKWLGSMSDISEASHVTGYSTISESVSSSQLIVHSSRVLTPKRHNSESVLYLNDSNNELLQQQNSLTNDAKSKKSLPQISSTLSSSPNSLQNDVVTNNKNDIDSTTAMRYMPNHRHSPSYPPMHTLPSIYSYQQQKTLQSDVLVNSDYDLAENKLNISAINLSSSCKGSKENINSLSPLPVQTYKSEGDIVSKSPTFSIGIPVSDKNSIQNTSPTGSKDTTTNDTQACYRSNHRLFPVSTYTEPIHSNTSQYVLHPKPQYSAGLNKNLAKAQQNNEMKTLPMKSLSPSHAATAQVKTSKNSPPYPSWQSVAALINDFERSKNTKEINQQHAQQPQTQAQKYTYIDPSKTHRISNPALKAFQKNAVQSYFERQQQQQKQNSPKLQKQQSQQQQQKNYQHIQQQQRPHSFQAAAGVKERSNQQSMRKSLPNTYATTTATNTTTSLSREPSAAAANSPTERDYYTTTTTTTTTSSSIKPASPTPPPPPPRSRSLMPTLLRRSSSASDYAEFKEQYTRNSMETLTTVRNVSSAEKLSFNDCGMPPPPPPPRGRPSASSMRCTSAASEYAGMRDKVLLQEAAALAHAQHHPQQHQIQASHCYPVSPLKVNISEDWVPERPPKNPNLRVPSPDLPPPPVSDAEIIGVSDEPLPPPPPEVFHDDCLENAGGYSQNQTNAQLLNKCTAANRRNSFAGSSTRKVLLKSSKSEQHQHQQPPLIPKKPQNIQLAAQVSARPALNLSQHTTKAHKVVLNGLTPPSNMSAQPMVGRKRTHNNATFINVQPVMEHVNPNLNMLTAKKCSPPPPLMPRVPVTSQAIIMPGPALAINTKLRCNSKASYLPRQSLEKLNNLDPDHGSYKLTLNSNEDLVVSSHQTKSSYDIFSHHHNQIYPQQHQQHHHHHMHNHHHHHGLQAAIFNGKTTPNNLPDVLPLGVKLHTQQAPQPSSPTSLNGTATLRYGSNNNLCNNSSSSTASSSPTASTTIYPPVYPPPPTQHRYSTPSMSTFNNTSTTQSYTRSQSFDATQSHSPTKYMSQSTMDLKKPPSLETTLEEPLSAEHLLSPAQSESNLSSPNKTKPVNAAQTNLKGLSPNSARREFHRSVDGGNNEGRIFRAELVNVSTTASNKAVARKESLRENIEKITQLQSKLMGAHLSGSFDGSKLTFGNYNTAKVLYCAIKTSPSLEQISSKCQEQPECHVEHKEINKTHVESVDTAALNENTSTPQPILQMDSDIDGLKLMQRSEIILRVNPSTIETACQTEDLADADMAPLTEHHGKEVSEMKRSTLQPRSRHPIEIDCDNTCKELAQLLPTQDKLLDILQPLAIKSPADYVNNLFNPNVALRPAKRDVGTSTLVRMRTQEQLAKQNETELTENLHIESTEYEISLMNGHEESDEEDGCNQIKKKVEELIQQVNCKISILNNEQTCINEETALNNELGSNLSNKLAEKVRPLEATKFRTYIEDVGHITSLLLSLAERLARAENALSSLEDSAEKKPLQAKRDRLLEQLDEAKRLKTDIDQRGNIMSNMLERNLSESENADFDYFINMKAKLIADARDIAEKIKCSEEQLNALNETLIQSDC